MAAVEDQAVTTGRAEDQSRLQELAKRHLWMHFTRMGGSTRSRDPDHRRAATGATSTTSTASATSTAWPRCSA